MASAPKPTALAASRPDQRAKVAGLFLLAWTCETLRQGAMGLPAHDAVFRALGYGIGMSAVALIPAAIFAPLLRRKGVTVWLAWAGLLALWSASALAVAVFSR